MRDSMRLVDGENLNRRSSNGGFAKKDCTLPNKVIFPKIVPGIEQRRQFLRARIASRDIRTFEVVAVKTGESQIAGLGKS